MTATISADNASGSKQRVIKTVVAVLAGHVAVLALLATMKPIPLRVVESPKPIEVKFVQLAPKPQPETPKPELPKPKEVKVVKEVPKPIPLPKPKPVIASAEPSPKPQQVVVPPQPESKPQPKEEPAPPPAAQPATPNQTPPVAASPKQVQTVAYIRKPDLNFTDDDLGNKPRTIKIKINIAIDGKVESIEVINSTGLTSLDRQIVQEWKRAKFTPYKENGIAIPTYQYQSFTLGLSQ